MSNTERGQPVLIQPVPEDRLHAIVRKTLGPRAVLQESRLLRGGQFNTAYYLETCDPVHRLVLRIAPSEDRRLFRYERGMMPAEPWIYGRLHAAGVPTARVVSLDTTRTIVDRVYILQEYVDAVPLNDKSVPDDIRPQLMREAGRHTARIHTIRGDIFGWPVGDGTVRGGASWAEVFGDLLTETCEEAVSMDVLHPDEAAAVLRHYHSKRDVFDACRTPVLVHNDIWAPNVLVGQTDGTWTVRAIIDADRAVFADREFEYILWDRDALWEDFMAGYGTPLDESPEAVLRRSYYRFYWYLFAAWAYRAQIWRPDAQTATQAIAMAVLGEILGPERMA